MVLKIVKTLSPRKFFSQHLHKSSLIFSLGFPIPLVSFPTLNYNKFNYKNVMPLYSFPSQVLFRYFLVSTAFKSMSATSVIADSIQNPVILCICWPICPYYSSVMLQSNFPDKCKYLSVG